MSFLQRLFLERIRLLHGCAGGQCVPLHIELRRGDQLRESRVDVVVGEALPEVERAGLLG